MELKMKNKIGVAFLSCSVMVAGCNSGNGSTNAIPANTIPDPSTDSVQVSMLQNSLSVKNGKSITMPIVFSTKKIGDRASNLQVSATDLPDNIKLVTHCDGGIITHGNGCHLLLSYAGKYASKSLSTMVKNFLEESSNSFTLDKGVLPISYSLTNSSGKPEVGTFNIMYQTTVGNNLQVSQTMPGVIHARTNRRTPVQLFLTTDDGQPVSDVSIKSLSRDVDVNLLATNDGNDGNLYSKVSGRVPLNFTIAPTANTVKGIKRLHFLIRYTTNGIVNDSTKNTVSRSLTATAAAGTVSQQEVSVDYDANDGGAAVIASVNPSSNITTNVGQSLPVTINFAASSYQVSQLTAQEQKVTPKNTGNFWTVTNTTTPCALVTASTTNCSISATYSPTSPLESGEIEFPYTYYVGNQQENSYVAIPFASSSVNSANQIINPAILPTTMVGTSSNFSVSLSSNFGNIKSVQLTGLSGFGTNGGFNNSLGLTLVSAASCAAASSATPCVFNFTYSPPQIAEPLTLNTNPVLNYSYVNNQGVTVTGALTLSLNPVYPMIFASVGYYMAGPYFGNNTSPQAGIYTGVITNGLLPESMAQLPNMPTGNSFTGVLPYAESSSDSLYISSVYYNDSLQYGNLFQYSLNSQPTQEIAPVFNYGTSNSLIFVGSGFTGLTGVAIGNNLNNPSYNGPYLFLPAEVSYMGPIFDPSLITGAADEGVGTAVGICSLGSGLTSCMSKNMPNTVGYNFYGYYDSSQNPADVSSGTIVFGWSSPSGYAVDGNGNFFVGLNTSASPIIGDSYTNSNLIKCTPSITGNNCSIWWTIYNPNHGVAKQASVNAVATDENYVYYGDTLGNAYKCSLSTSQQCIPMGNVQNGEQALTAMSADGSGNLFVADINGRIWNPAISNSVQYVAKGKVTAMAYYAPTNSLYFSDMAGGLYACKVTSGQLSNCAIEYIDFGLPIISIALMSFN